MLDPHVRYPGDDGPLWPGKSDLRYTLVEGGDPDLRRVRENVQEGGVGLFVVHLGGSGVKALIEAYYPDNIREAYFEKSLDKYRKSESRQGRLIAISQISFWHGELDMRIINMVQRNNRNARRDLRRSHSATDHRIALDNDLAAKEQEAYDNFEDFYTNAMVETHKFGMGKKHISQATPRGRR